MVATLEVCLPRGLQSSDTARLCAAVAARLGAEPAVRVRCRVDRVPVDLGVVDALARLALTARRAGARLSVHRPSAELRSLLQLLGLDDLLGQDDLPAPSPGAGRDRLTGGGPRRAAHPYGVDGTHDTSSRGRP